MTNYPKVETPTRLESFLQDLRASGEFVGTGDFTLAIIDKVLLAAQPTGQFVTVEQVADTVTFLLSSSAASITGTAISIDGGRTAQ